jgi:hypothetical protein
MGKSRHGEIVPLAESLPLFVGPSRTLAASL